MACEGCAIKFTLFKRKKQCTDCLRYYCTNCLTRCTDRRLNCDKCCVLSRRPLIRSSLLEMRAKDLQHYLMAKKISTRGCVEKDDLVNLVIQHANATNCNSSNQRTGSNFDDNPFMNAVRGFTSNIFTSSTSDTPNFTRSENNARQEAPTCARPAEPREYPRQAPRNNEPNVTSSADHSNSAPNSRSRSPSNSYDRQTQQNPQMSNSGPTPIITSPETENASSFTVPPSIEIEELFDSDCSQTAGPEPLVTEQEESTATNQEQRSEMVTELLSHTGATVRLSDISDVAGLEALNVKQLKDLLTINRVNFKGCVERSELLDRASRLWQQHAKSREDLEKLGSEELCKICMDAPVECVMLECGHMATCTNCGKQLSECPICRQYVIRVVRTFRA